MSNLKILISGPSGTGKSTVAEMLAIRKGIPFLKAKDVTNPILKRDNYDYASGVQVEKFLQTPERQDEILSRTMEQIKIESFVTDRGLVDLAAYAMLGYDTLREEDISHIVEVCQKNVKKYTHVFVFKPGELINNGKRTMNKNYQDLVYRLELGLLTDWGITHCLIDNCGIDPQCKLDQMIEFVDRI